MYILSKKRICLSVLHTNKRDLRRSNAYDEVQKLLKSAILKKIVYRTVGIVKKKVINPNSK